jgi:hypothetical protein
MTKEILEKLLLLGNEMFNFKNLKMNLNNLNLVELNAQEVVEVEGGGKGTWIKKLFDAAGVYDAIDDFMTGWNSVPSGSQGTW